MPTEIWSRVRGLDRFKELYSGSPMAVGCDIRHRTTPVDLVFGAQSELRAVAEAYAADDARERFVQDFVKAWAKGRRRKAPIDPVGSCESGQAG